MIIVTTHNNTDFDALASMVAAAFIYPEAVRIMPSQVSPPVREFLAVHWDLLRLKSRKGADLSGVDRLIVTDTSSWERLDNMQELEVRKDLDVVSAYLDSSLDAKHIDIFSRMLSSSKTFYLGSRKIGICVESDCKGLNMLSSVVNRFKEIKGLDAALGIFPIGSNKTVVIGRGKANGVDLGVLMRKLGGGGHPGAGSATVKGTVDEVYDQISDLIINTEIYETRVETAMTRIEHLLSSKNSLRNAQKLLKKSGRHALLVADDSRLLGLIGENQLAKIRNESQWNKPVTSMLVRDISYVGPDESLRSALNLMSRSETGFLPVVENSRLVGEITRASIILQMYDF